MRYLLLIAFVATLITPINLSEASPNRLTLTARYQESEPVTLDLATTSEVLTIDPAVAVDQDSVEIVNNLFLGLTDIDPFTGEIVPELATDWDISADGKVWTFHLRDDVDWYRYDPESETAEKIRPVVAQDFVYGIKRACDPRLYGYYGTIAAQVIAGCDVVNGTAAEDVTDELVFGDTTQVHAIDDQTLEIQLQFSAGYFFSMTPMAILKAVPPETIAEFGEEWTLPGNIVTNGAYFVQEITRGGPSQFVRNPYLNEDLQYGGNIEWVNFTFIAEYEMLLPAYDDNLLDQVYVPTPQLDVVLGNPTYADQLNTFYDLTAFFFRFNQSQPPFDNVHARRAFSAIIDREKFIDEILRGRGEPMLHFTPPGIQHAPPIDEIGIGFDPAYAREQLVLAGYPDCTGIPQINILVYASAGNWAEFWADAAINYLGCTEDDFLLETYEFGVIVDPICMPGPDCPLELDYPNAYSTGWGPDYPDAHNWVGDVLHCQNPYGIMNPVYFYDSVGLYRTCTETDELIETAAAETNQVRRAELYRQIEEGFFGEEGEYPLAPIYTRTQYHLVRPWYTGPFATDAIFTGAHWDAYSIDMNAKVNRH